MAGQKLRDRKVGVTFWSPKGEAQIVMGTPPWKPMFVEVVAATGDQFELIWLR
jgi:hypothetical protein